MLMFATDYPHWDFDAPDQALPGRLPLRIRAKIMAENARALYRLRRICEERRMARYVVGTVDEIPPGTRKIVEIAGRSIGVFNVGGEFFALRNRCPHQGGRSARGGWPAWSNRPVPATSATAGRARSCAAPGTWEYTPTPPPTPPPPPPGGPPPGRIRCRSSASTSWSRSTPDVGARRRAAGATPAKKMVV